MIKTMPKTFVLIFLVGLLLPSNHSTALSGDGLRTVAFTDGPIPGAAPGVNFGHFFNVPTLNDNGQTTFKVRLTGTGIDATNDDAILSEGAGGVLALVAREGGQAPGTDPGVNFSGFSGAPVVINTSGQTAFEAVLSGTGIDTTNDNAIFSEGGGSGLALVAREGSFAPGTDPGVSFDSFYGAPAFNDSGQLVFGVVLAGTGINGTNDNAIYREGGDSRLELVAREGSPAPGTALGVKFGRLYIPVLNDKGQTAFSAKLTDSGNGVFSEGGGGGLALVAREGGQAPGVGPGVSFAGLSSPALNNNGHTAFEAFLAGAGVNSTNDNAIFSEGAGNGLAMVVREGSPAPGTDPGVTFGDFFGAVVLNGNGHTAFEAGLTGTGVNNTNEDAIYSEGGGNGLTLVAREGSQAPGTDPGVRLGDFPGIPVLNANGQTAFTAFLTGTGVDSSNGLGLFAEDSTGDLKLIARQGDLLDVSDDPLSPDFRTISNLRFNVATGNEDGRSSSFNDVGQLVFNAAFTDGTSGCFLSNLVAIPEPSTLLLGAMATVGLLMPRRRSASKLPPRNAKAPPRNLCRKLPKNL